MKELATGLGRAVSVESFAPVGAGARIGIRYERGLLSVNISVEAAAPYRVAKDGGWFALAGGWNNPEAAVDETRFIALITRAADLAAGK